MTEQELRDFIRYNLRVEFKPNGRLLEVVLFFVDDPLVPISTSVIDNSLGVEFS